MESFLNWFNENKFRVGIAVIFLITLSIRIYAISNKTTVIFDAPASLLCATPNNLFRGEKEFKYYWSEIDFKARENYTAYELKKALFESKAGLKSIWKDLFSLHFTTIDTQHPNLYYSILRVWTSGMDYTDSKAMIMRSCSLNLIFFAFSFFFMYKLLNLIRPEKEFILLGLFFAFITTGSISNSLMIRPYPMMEAFFTLSIYLFLSLYKRLESYKEFKLSRKEYFLYPLAIALFLLSHYYSAFVVFFIFVATVFKCIEVKNFKFLKTLPILIIISFLYVLLFCPLYFDNFLVIEHWEETLRIFNLMNYLDFYQYGIHLLKIFILFIFNNIGVYLVLFVFALIKPSILRLDKLKDFDWKVLSIIICIVVIGAYIITTIEPFDDPAAMRYVIAGFPVVSIVLTLITYCFRKGIIYFLVLLTLLTSVVSVSTNLSMLNSKFKNLGAVKYYKDFSHFDLSKNIYDKNGKIIPVVIINRNWLYPNYIFYLPDDAIVRLEERMPPENFIFAEYLLVNAYDENVYHVTKKGKKNYYKHIKEYSAW